MQTACNVCMHVLYVCVCVCVCVCVYLGHSRATVLSVSPPERLSSAARSHIHTLTLPGMYFICRDRTAQSAVANRVPDRVLNSSNCSSFPSLD